MCHSSPAQTFLLVLAFTLSMSYSQNKEWNLLVETELARYTGSQVFETDSFYITFGHAVDTFNRIEGGFAFSKIDKLSGQLMDHFFYKELGVQFTIVDNRNSHFDGKFVVFPIMTRFSNSTIQIIKFNIHTFSFEKIAIIPTPVSNKYAFHLNDFIQIDSFYFVDCSHAYDEETTSTLISESILLKINAYTGQYQYIHYNKKLEKLICNRILLHKEGILLFCELVGDSAANGNLRLYHLSLKGDIIWEYTFPTTVSYAFIRDVLPISEHEFLFSSYTSGGQSGVRMAVGRMNVETKETIWVTVWNEPYKLNIFADAKIVPTATPNEYLWMSNDFIQNDSLLYTAGRITRFTADGKRLWYKTYYYHNNIRNLSNRFYNIIKTQDNSYLTVGGENLIQTTWLVKINEEGDILPIDTTSSVVVWEEDLRASNVSVYPNPASESIIINQGEISDMTYRLIDLSGHVVKTLSMPHSHHNTIWDISSVPRGTYTLLMIQNGEKIGQIRQVVVR